MSENTKLSQYLEQIHGNVHTKSKKLATKFLVILSQIW